MPRRPTLAALLGLTGLLIAVLASWVAIDSRSIDGFEAPKWLLVELGLAIAALSALWEAGRGPGKARSGLARSIPILFGIAVAGAVVSALASSRRSASLDTLRTSALLLLAVPIGASAVFARWRVWINAAFLAGAALNVLLVLLAAFHAYAPVAVIGETEQALLGGLVGNAGHLAIGLSLAAAACPSFLESPSRLWRTIAALLFLGNAAGVLATRTLTGVLATSAGVVIFALSRFRRRAVPYVAAIAVLAAGSLALPAVRARAVRITEAVRARDWNRALTARGAPWLAAGEMIRHHAIVGVGPGNFASEFVPARLQAEARLHRRLVLPGLRTNSFAQAHNDYLDCFAAIGIPAGACAIAAYLLLAIRLARLGGSRPEAAGIAGTLGAGAIAAAAWFPFQVPVSLLWLLLSAGRGYRVVE